MDGYDVIVIGAGHNGLIFGAYLARAGAKVLVLEKSNEIGGGMRTEEVTVPGFLHNTHATYHMMADYMPAIRDLELEKYGVSFVLPDVQVAGIFDDSCVVLYNELKKSVRSISKLSEKDAEMYEKLYRKSESLVKELIIPLTYLPPLPPMEQVEILSKTELGRELLELTEYSPVDFVTEHFEDERIRALMLYLICYWGLDPELTGLGFLIPLYLERATNYRVLLGGSHRFTSALSKVIHKNGGRIAEVCEVEKILIEDGNAVGVKLSENSAFLEKEIKARIVASSLNPIQTFVELIDAENLEERFRREILRWEWEDWSLFSVHLAMNEPPKFKVSDFEPDVNKALRCISGYNSVEDVMSIWKDIRSGKLPKISGSLSCFTLFDPSMAPPNKHVCFIAQFSPYEVDGDPENWYRVKESYMERCIEKWSEYAPNLRGSIIRAYSYSPLDIELKISSMTRGSIKHGKYTPLQMGYFRPHPDASAYRTPVKNLYVCGSSVYPGGLILGAPGYNAANVVAEDMGIERWWDYPDYVKSLKAKYGF